MVSIDSFSIRIAIYFMILNIFALKINIIIDFFQGQRFRRLSEIQQHARFPLAQSMATHQFNDLNVGNMVPTVRVTRYTDGFW